MFVILVKLHKTFLLKNLICFQLFHIQSTELDYLLAAVQEMRVREGLTWEKRN